MKFLSVFILTALTAYAAFLFADQSPWWIFAIGALIAGWVVPLPSFKAWLAAFLGVFVLWSVLCYMADDKNHGILSAKMAEVLPLGGSPMVLILVTALIGALVAGFSALTGSYLRRKPVK
jgi:peptidoglycan/LPS O-acetylase OafA/YrhL